MSSSQKKQDEGNRKGKITFDQIQKDRWLIKYINDQLNELNPLLNKLPDKYQSRIKALPILKAELLCLEGLKFDRGAGKVENLPALDIILLNLALEGILSKPRTIIYLLKYLLDECPSHIRALVLGSHDDDTDKFPDVKLLVETLQFHSLYWEGRHKTDFWRRYAETHRAKRNKKILQELAKHKPEVKDGQGTAKKKKRRGRQPDATRLERLLELVGLFEKRKKGECNLTIKGIKSKVARKYGINQDTLTKWLENHMYCLPKQKEVTDITEDDVRLMWSEVYGNTDFD